MDNVLERQSVFQLHNSVIFHFSYLMHLESCNRGELDRTALQEGSSSLQRKSVRLVMNSPVTMSLSFQVFFCGETLYHFLRISAETSAISQECHKCHRIKIPEDLLTVHLRK